MAIVRDATKEENPNCLTPRKHRSENERNLFILQALQIHFRVAGIIDFFPV
jgi:hypothetical protein